MCDKLFDIDAQLNIVPQLALSHETSADGKTVTLKLRPNVKFHDGEPFNAEAVKFTLDRGLTMEIHMSAIRNHLFGFRNSSRRNRARAMSPSSARPACRT